MSKGVAQEESAQEGSRKYKIIILGESGVGKTSLFSRYVWDEFRESLANTIGVNNILKELVIDGHSVHLNLWDTAGQERFKSLVYSFYRDSDGFVLVYDLTDIRSLDFLRQLVKEDTGWIEPRFTVVIGNKADCLDDEQLEEAKNSLREFAEANGFENYYLASAKTGTNVNEMFDVLACKVFYNRQKDTRTKNRIDITQRKRKKVWKRWCYM